MDARRPKYSLFPASPSSKPVSSHAPSSPARQDSPTLGPEDPTTSRHRSPPPPAQPLPSESPSSESLPLEPHDQPTYPDPSHPDYRLAPPPQPRPPPEPDYPISPTEMTASSFSTTSGSSLKPTPISLPPRGVQPYKGPKRAFIRHGLGGAGNYHKRPDSPPNPDYSGFLSTLFGTFSTKKRKTRQYSGADTTGYSQYSNQALPLGAAEVLKRKMLGQRSGRRRSTSNDRS